MTRPWTGSRRGLALIGALLWLLGVEALPNLHLGLHGVLAPHEHGGRADGHARHDAAHDHDHDHDHAHAHTHEHEHGDHRDDAVPAGLGLDERDHEHAELTPIAPAHGRHDLLHRGVAITQPPAAWPVGASAALEWVPWLPTARGRPYSNEPEHARARGPPA